MSFTTSTPVEAILRMANLHTVTKEKWKSLTKEVLSDLVMHFVAECKMNTDKVNTYIDTMATKITNPQDQLLTKLTEHMNKMQDELNTLKQSQSDPKPALNTPPSLEFKEKTDYVLRISPQRTEGDENDEAPTFDKTSWKDVLTSDFSQKLAQVPVNSELNREGQGILAFKNKEDCNTAKAALCDDFTITEDTVTKSQIYPKLRLKEIDGEKYNNDNKPLLIKDILTKNKDIANLVNSEQCLLEVIFVQPGELGYSDAILKVHPKIRHAIMTSERIIHLDMSRIHVRDQIHVTQCFDCQKFGHKRQSPECRATSNKLICLYCAGNHKSSTCTVKKDRDKHICSNCSTSTVQSHRNNKNHSSTNINCPFVQRERNFIISRTAGLDSKNLYEQRTINRRKASW